MNFRRRSRAWEGRSLDKTCLGMLLVLLLLVFCAGVYFFIRTAIHP